MPTINLLPKGASFKGKDKILIEGLRKFSLVGFMVFIVVVLVLTGYLIYTSLKIRSSVNSEESLKSQVDVLSQTEQSFFLIKDRIAKIKNVLAKEASNGQIKPLSDFLNGLSGDVKILEVQITSQKIGLSLLFPSSEAFGIFYKSLVTSETYKTVILKSFSFNPSAGFVATLELVNK